MKYPNRRHHSLSDRIWSPKEDKTGYTDGQVNSALLQDIRAVLADVLDQQKETNRILRMAFGVTKEDDDGVV